jgi:hypothetical protein
MKPGIYTTEFWISLIGNVLAFAVALGVVSSSDKATLEGALTTIVTASIALIGAATVIVTYVRGRIAVKTQGGDVQMLALAVPDQARTEAKAVGMPLLTLILLAIQYRGELAKLLEAIRNWRK